MQRWKGGLWVGGLPGKQLSFNRGAPWTPKGTPVRGCHIVSGFGSLELFGTLVFIGFELPPPLAVLSFSQFLHVEARFAKVLAYDARQMQRGNPIGLHLPCPDGTQIL
jgi:hypothetical protein